VVAFLTLLEHPVSAPRLDLQLALPVAPVARRGVSVVALLAAVHDPIAATLDRL
jgi:hypothetical protein